MFFQSTKQGQPKFDAAKLVHAQQIHGSRIAVVGKKDWGQVIPGVDGLVTKTPGTALAVRTADCFPVGFADEASGVWGIAHCGWRGLTAGVIENLVKVAQTQGAQIQSAKIFIGAGIGPCHFEVKEDVAELFLNSVKTRGGKKFVNLGQEIVGRLMVSGVQKQNISADKRCTFCEADTFYSWRRENRRPAGEMLSVITLG